MTRLVNPIDVTKQSFFLKAQICDGYRLHDIGHAVQEYAESNGFGVIREYLGHGIGLFMKTRVNYGDAHTGPHLKEGMVLAIELMITQGSYGTRVLGNDWTVS